MPSRQYKWQLIKLKNNLCVTCGKPANSTNKRFCESHRIKWLKLYHKHLKNKQ